MGLVKNLISSLIFFSLFASLAIAVPTINIISPQNITYTTTKILVNVTSDIDTNFFYISNGRNKKSLELINNTTNFKTYLYVKNGDYNYTIWAGNSTSNVSKSIVFKVVNVSNPINITECGQLLSSNTLYFLRNNIKILGGACIFLWNLRNASIDLNQYSINSSMSISVMDSTDIQIYNGSIYQNGDIGGDHLAAIALDAGEGTSTTHLQNLYLEGGRGMSIWTAGLLAENITINATVGIHINGLSNGEFRNISIHNRGGVWVLGKNYGIVDWSLKSDITFNNLTFWNNFDTNIWLDNVRSTYYLRNSPIDFNKVKLPEGWFFNNRIYIQHRTIVNATDNRGRAISATIEANDNGNITSNPDDEIIYKSILNPTKRFTATDQEGHAEIWVTEKLKHYKSNSPIDSEYNLSEYVFSPYNITSRSANDTKSYTLNLTGSNSTFTINFTMNIPEELPVCTLAQMFDLNGDGIVNIQDGALILRHIIGQSVSINTTKACEGRSFFAS